PASKETRSCTSAKRIVFSPTTGPTSDKRGSSCTRSRARPSTTTATGYRTCARLGLRTTIRPWRCDGGAPKRADGGRGTMASTTRPFETKLEVVIVPVSDVGRAKKFYEGLGWRLDADFAGADDFRVVQFTPPGSDCSIILGKEVTNTEPGSLEG